MSGWVDDTPSGGGGWVDDAGQQAGSQHGQGTGSGGGRGRDGRRPSRRERKEQLEARRAALRAAGIEAPTARPGTQAATAERWRAARPELRIAVIAVAAITLAGGAVAGWSGAVTAAAVAAALSLIVLRGLIPRSAEQSVRVARDKQVARSIFGYAQRRFVVESSVRNRPFYESDLRPVLEHILAARLAESQGINLYTEPAAARDAFCRTRADEALWPWVDPKQALDADARARQRSGIPSRTLARLIDRLEAL